MELKLELVVQPHENESSRSRSQAMARGGGVHTCQVDGDERPILAEYYTVGNGIRLAGSSSKVFRIIIKTTCTIYHEKNGVESTSTIFKSMDTSIEGRCQIERNTP